MMPNLKSWAFWKIQEGRQLYKMAAIASNLQMMANLVYVGSRRTWASLRAQTIYKYAGTG